jgi:hypothetical protein
MRWIFKKQTTLRFSTRASQHPRKKALLSKQTRVRKRKLWLRALMRKKKKKKKKRKKTMKENMMKIKWLYSSRNSTSSSRREDLTREKGKRSQDQRGCATITIRIGTLLPNAHVRGRKKTMTREKGLTKVTRKIRKTLRRSLMFKSIMAKNGTQVMRVPSRNVMSQQP